MAGLYDTFQGSIGTVSPVFGQYKQLMGIDLDIGISGINGLTGAGTLQPYNVWVGITGIQGSSQVHSKWEY